jgi:transposase
VKGPLRVRPVFLHTDERIQVLVFFNLVALLVRAILAALWDFAWKGHLWRYSD